MPRTTTRVSVGGRSLTLSNLEKVLWPDSGLTKRHLVDYYRRVSKLILPHLAGRPITLKRYPNGIEDKFFYEKRCPSHRPEWAPTCRVPGGRSGEIEYCLALDEAGLAWLANLATIEMHPMLYRCDRVDRPTMVVLDLDPGPPAGLIDCARVALRVRDVLADIGLEVLAKVSGGKGIHLALPLNTEATFDQTKGFARTLARALEKDEPDRVVSRMSKALRKGKVFIDWSQNDVHKTTVSVYSLRAQPGGTVSMPVTWQELEGAVAGGSDDGLVFGYEAALERLEARGDLWSDLLRRRQRLPS